MRLVEIGVEDPPRSVEMMVIDHPDGFGADLPRPAPFEGQGTSGPGTAATVSVFELRTAEIAGVRPVA